MPGTPLQGGSFLSRAMAMLCFGVLGALATRRGNSSAAGLTLSAGCGILAAWLYLKILSLFLYSCNGEVRRNHGWGGFRQAIGRSFVLMIPFTVLAVVADLGLDWNAAQSFTAAGVMTAGGAVGADLIQLGGGKVGSLLLPSLGGLGFSTLWMLLGTMLKAVEK